MAVVLRATMPGFTAAKYDELVVKLESVGAGSPAGRLLLPVAVGRGDSLREVDRGREAELACRARRVEHAPLCVAQAYVFESRPLSRHWRRVAWMPTSWADRLTPGARRGTRRWSTRRRTTRA